MGAVAGAISGGMGFAFTGGVKGVALTLKQTLTVGGVTGAGSSLFSDLGDILIRGEDISAGRVIGNMAVSGVAGVVFAGIGYGISKGIRYLGNKGGTPTYGYSEFADGMSPEDATRYIANNEKAFFNEFSERASAAGLSDVQITEAFEAMRTGDYTKMATYFDTSSPVDGAVFWSGNKEGAAAYANSIGGTIMEQTPGGQVFDNWRGLQGMYPEWYTGTAMDQKPIWNALSAQYAEGAVGDVAYVHIMKEGKPYYGAVWNDIEKKILLQNMLDGKVTNISEVIIDAK